jgi:protein subunit release factor B
MIHPTRYASPVEYLDPSETKAMSSSIPASDDDLLAECDVETFRASGPGGQNVNRRETAVRLRHRPTGLVAACQQERSQHQNKMLALRVLRRKIESLFHRRRPRIPTAVPRSARNRILAQKKRQGLKKRLRKEGTADE